MVVACGARFTVVEDLASDGMFSGWPLSAVKFTVKETEAELELAKYIAVYQPPPNANCDRICGLTGGEVAASPPILPPVKLADMVAAPLVGSSVDSTFGELAAPYSLPFSKASPAM